MASSYPSNTDDIFRQFFGSDATPPFDRNFQNISSPNSSRFDSGSANDVFQQIFSDGVGVSRKAAAMECKLSCSLEELYCGSTRKMKISRNVVQPNNGRLVQESEIIQIDVKAGWKTGTKITFANKGNQELNQIPADVVFIIDEKPHGIYKRDDNDLIVNHKLSLADALAGTTVNLKTLDGRNLLVPVTEIVRPGYELVVAGEGMPISKNAGGVKGNLKIKFDVKFPTRLTPDQKRAIRRDLEG